MLGRLMDAFEESEYTKNTILVLWSDHGMHMGEKENIEKFTLWERSTRVPLIISAPGLTRPGTQSEQPVSLMDLYPTLAELAGFDQPSHLDGQSLAPQIEKPDTETKPVISSYKFSWAKDPIIGHAVRSKRYRYIYYPEINLEELYDHDTDPNEWDNIAYRSENKPVIEAHRKVLLNMLPDLLWEGSEPVGYTVDSDGNVKKDDYH
jgi:arylsulfatase A-like enzyme